MIPDLIKIYPNPANQILNIEFPQNFAKISNIKKLEVYDITGRKLLQQEFTDQNIQELNVSKFAQGIYFVKVGSITKRFEVK